MQIDSPKESFEAMHLLKGLTPQLMCAFDFRSRNSTVSGSHRSAGIITLTNWKEDE